MSNNEAENKPMILRRRQLARSMAEADADLPHDQLVDLLANLYLSGVEGVTDKDVEAEEEDYVAPSLTADTKTEIREFVANHRLACCFGDGMEMQYILEGCSMTGLDEMSDEELVEELETIGNVDEALVARAKKELERQ